MERKTGGWMAARLVDRKLFSLFPGQGNVVNKDVNAIVISKLKFNKIIERSQIQLSFVMNPVLLTQVLHAKLDYFCICHFIATYKLKTKLCYNARQYMRLVKFPTFASKNSNSFQYPTPFTTTHFNLG